MTDLTTLDGFTIDGELDYGEAWEHVESYLLEALYVTDFWQHRTLCEYEDHMAGFVNGAVWVADYDEDDDGWRFEFVSYETYQEFYD